MEESRFIAVTGSERVPVPGAHAVGVADAGQFADTRALTLREADYPPVQYIPLDDVDASLLEATDHTTYCPYKGDCSYYSIPIGGAKSVNAVWTYEAPFASVAEIKDRVAFYPDRVDAIVEQKPSAPGPAASSKASG